MAQAKTASRTEAANAPKAASQSNLPATAASNHPVAKFKEYAMQRIATLQELPHIDPQQLLSVALTAIQRKPDLMRCTPQSLWNACVLAAQDGLLPDGREGAIVPYGENQDGKRVAEIATWMPMVEGLRKKVRNSGKIKDWYVEVVYAGDFFRYRKGDDPRLEHEPVPPSMRTQGLNHQGIIAAYSIAVFPDGTRTAPELMWIEEIEAVRSKSKAKNGPWQDATFYPEMCKKVVARRHYKQLPKAPGLDKLIQRDDDDYDLDRQNENLIEHRNQRRLISTTDAFNQFAGDGAADDDGFGAFDDQPPVGRRSLQDAPATREKPAEQRSAAREDDPPAEQQAEQSAISEASEVDQQQEAAGSASTKDSVGEEFRRWPPGEKPSDPDEYEHYLETKLSDFTNADDVAPWFKSTEEATLRKACKLSQDQFNAMRDKAVARVSELKKAAR